MSGSPPGRFDHVDPKVDTGFNRNKLLQIVDERHIFCRYSRQKDFKVIGGKVLIELLNSPDVKVLLLDVREAQAFRDCRLMEGTSGAPAANPEHHAHAFELH